MTAKILHLLRTCWCERMCPAAIAGVAMSAWWGDEVGDDEGRLDGAGDEIFDKLSKSSRGLSWSRTGDREVWSSAAAGGQLMLSWLNTNPSASQQTA
jgi:hypothetical protein